MGKNFDLSHIHDSWKEFFDDENIKLILEDIERKIGEDFYPAKENIFRFADNDIKKVKYVLVGMDPYPTSFIKNNKRIPTATGRSFESANINSWLQPIKQKSLVNILKCFYQIETNKDSKDIRLANIRKDIKMGKFEILSPKELFDDLESQGVLFLNTALTVKENKSGSHIKIWKEFYEELVKYMIYKNNNIKWLLCGKYAKKSTSKYVDSDNPITSGHPRFEGFIDENIFKSLTDIKWIGKK